MNTVRDVQVGRYRVSFVERPTGELVFVCIGNLTLTEAEYKKLQQVLGSRGADAEYLRRNEMLAKALGAKSALESVQRRYRALKNRPARWLYRGINAALIRLDGVEQELVAHRDEVKQ